MTKPDAGRTLPLALLVCGPPGSGKTTLGAVLAARLGAAFLDLDTATQELTAIVSGLAGVRDLDDPSLVSLTRRARYETLTGLMVDSLRVGTDVVGVAPFTTESRDPRSWARLQSRLRAAGGEPSLVWLRLTSDEVDRRISRRGAHRDLVKLRSRTEVVSPGGSLEPAPPLVAHLEGDALLPPDVLAERILSLMGRSARSSCASSSARPGDRTPGG